MSADMSLPPSGGSHLIPTASQTVGPFFHFALVANTTLGCLVPSGTHGDRIRLRIRVLDGAGAPVTDALVELYHADADGKYAQPEDMAALNGPRDSTLGAFCGFGRLPTNTEGACVFETIRPGRVAGNGGVLQASHINVCLFARGLQRHLYTRIYFEADAALPSDPVLAVVPANRRPTLTASPDTEDPGLWTFDIRLQGEDETVFFDL
jgi:protocatechuate 3,4-dioxygenase, alpha subunit